MPSYLPLYLRNRSVNLYIGVLLLCNLLFINNRIPLIFGLFGLIEVFTFFYLSNQLSQNWIQISQKTINTKIFIFGFGVRLLWVIFSYIFYNVMTGQPFEFASADAKGYHDEAIWFSNLIKNNEINVYFDYIKDRYSDMGYPYYLGWQYWITGGSIILARILKAIYGAYTCVLIYKLAQRNFGEEVGRLSGIFCILLPNLVYYSGLHTKEVEMLLLSTFFVERADFVFRQKKINLRLVLLIIVLAGFLFFFRTVLGLTALFSLLSSVLLSRNRVVKIGNRALMGIWVTVAVMYFACGKIANEVEKIWEARESNQTSSFTFRAERTNGNKFAKYVSGAVFVPLIVVIPFPTLVGTPNQENQQLLNGGNFVKNILSFFFVVGLYWLARNRLLRNHVLLLTYTFGYLIIIALSAFAQAERFHQPAIPLIMIFAALGISKLNNNIKPIFSWYMLFLFVAIIYWSWFKLAGRGMV